MDDYPKEIVRILKADRLSSLSETDKLLLENWRKEDVANERLYNYLCDQEQLAAAVKSMDEFPLAAAWERQLLHITQSEKPRTLVRSWSLWVSVAAAILLVFAAKQWIDSNEKVSDLALAEIQPGKDQAYITLDDGTVVALSAHQVGLVLDSSMRYEDGNAVLAEKDKPLNFSSFELTVPRAGQYRMTLPDGSKVWLNAATHMAYHENEKERRVELAGEAYFEIQPKQLATSSGQQGLKPFKVVVDKQVVHVLGTHFNVKAYPADKKAYTTLVEGCVQLTAAQGSLVLHAGEQGFAAENQLLKRRVDLSTVLAWKEGYFVFQAEPLDEVLRQVGRWYDVDFVIEDLSLNAMPFEAMVPRFGKLKDLLDLLEKTNKIYFKYDGRKVYVIRK